MNASVRDRDGSTQEQAFISDLAALRSRAREQILKDAVAPSHPEADRKAIVELLNTALAAVIV